MGECYISTGDGWEMGCIFLKSELRVAFFGKRLFQKGVWV